MMQLVCNGHRLDLYENTDLQFTEENPLFAFDSIKCERTTNFKLPATPANDRAFSLARIPAYAGEGMRRKFAAQLQLGTIVKDGYLYVSSWSGKEYEAIFVTGEMVGLQAIKDAGKIAEYYRPNNTLIWSTSQIKDANTAAGQTIWALTRYLCGNANLILPSADLADIISNAYFAVTQRQLAGLQRGWRLIPNELKGIPTSSLEVHYEGTGNSPGALETNPADANRMSTTLAPLVRFINTTLVMYDGQLNDRFWRVQQLVAGQTLRLTFPADFSSDYFLIGIRDLGTQGTDPLYFPFSTEWFLGGYYFSPNLNTNTNVTYGAPLAGKTVEIPAGTPFVFVKKNWITWRPNVQGSAGVIYGFTQLADVGNVYTLTIQADGNDIASGNVVRLADNLPELTLIELLKIYAYLTGTQLYYNGQDIEFDDLFFISWKRFDISKQLLSIGKVTRTFADYAQRNIVGFDSADDVLYAQRITAEYDINNDNIETNKEIGKIPYSEGQIGIANNEQVAQFDMEESYGKKMQKSGIMEARGIAPDGNTHGLRVTLPTNAGIQAICDASTQVEVQARMSAYEYAQINAKTRILCRGTEYVWTSRSWQKDIAKFVLAKLPPLSWGELLVDMGLPSGTKWCSVDIDVTKKYGFAETPFTYEKSFFSWGNIDGHNPTSSNSFAPWSWGGVNSQAPWYQGQVYGNTPGNTLTGDIPIGEEFDAARAHLGTPWRMPTSADYAELFANIRYINADGTEIPTSQTNKKVTVNGVVGLYLESRLNGARLFFSASGYGNGTNCNNRGVDGDYWASSLDSSRNAYGLDFGNGGVNPQYRTSRHYGFAVRAVQ